MRFSFGKKLHFKSLYNNLYNKVLKKYKRLVHLKYNIYVEDKLLTFRKFPNFVQNLRLKSNDITFITPIKLSKDDFKKKKKKK